MGGSQSTGKIVQNTTEANRDLSSGVTISGNVIEKGYVLEQSLEKQLQEAFQRGKDDGVATIQQSLSAVAAQTFDQIHSQLKVLQENQIEESKAMAIDISKKLSKPLPLKKSCDGEESELINCLKLNSNSPLACQEYVETYSACSSAVLKRFLK